MLALVRFEAIRFRLVMTVRVPKSVILILLLAIGAGGGAAAVLLLSDDSPEEPAIPDARKTDDAGDSGVSDRASRICEQELQPEARLSLRRLQVVSPEGRIPPSAIERAVEDLRATAVGLRALSGSPAINEVADAQGALAESGSDLQLDPNDAGSAGAFFGALDGLRAAARDAKLPNCYLR